MMCGSLEERALPCLCLPACFTSPQEGARQSIGKQAGRPQLHFVFLALTVWVSVVKRRRLSIISERPIIAVLVIGSSEKIYSHLRTPKRP